MNEEKKVLYVIKDKWGHQLSAPNSDDNALWDRVEAMEERGRTGLYVVAYGSEGANESLVEDIPETLTESHEDTVEFVMQIEDMIREVTPKIIDKAFGKSYSFELDGEGSEEDAMEDFREAVHSLAMAIYSMVVTRRNDYDESLEEASCDKQLTESRSPFDYELYTSEVIENSYQYDNDDFVQREQKLFNLINKKLQVKDALVVVDTEAYFDPLYLDIDTVSEDEQIGMDCEYYVVDGIPLVVEHNTNGNNYMFFRNSEEARDYEKLVDEYYEDDIDEGIADVVGTVVGGIAKAGAKVIDSIDKLHS